MSTYSQIAWLPLTAGLTLIGLIISFFVWRRRGAAAGLRGVAWSLLPLAAYLIGAIELLWRFGTAIGNFAGSFVFSPKVWAGIIVVIVSVVLFSLGGLFALYEGWHKVTHPEKVESWDCDTALVTIQVDSSDRVAWGAFDPRYVENESVLQKALGWAGRQWHHRFP